MSLAGSFPPPPPPPPPGGHGLLEGKVVIVTAAAGTGIGSATARRCLEEGATVVVSDAHERRLAESAEELAAVAGAHVLGVPCDVTREDDVQASTPPWSSGTGGSTWPCTTPASAAPSRWWT